MPPIHLTRSMNYLMGREEISDNPWADKCLIPLLTRLPYHFYPDGFLEREAREILFNGKQSKEIICLEYDSVKVPSNERKLFNVLLLSYSGSGKSLMLKNIWSHLADAGYFICYIDSKGTESGRAKLGWNSPKIAPLLKPKGIKLKHFMPYFATKDITNLQYFKIYSLRLNDIEEKYMWMGLGLTNTGASKISKLVYQTPNLTLEKLYFKLSTIKDDEKLNSTALNSIYNKLTDIEDLHIIDDTIPKIDLLKEWKAGYSVCISYNAREELFMSFDIGEKIRKAKNYYSQNNNRNPIMFILDDSGFYSKNFPNVPLNYAVQEIKNIGHHYRALLVYNIMAVQSLKIIDEQVAETYPIKLISPRFADIDSLKDIGIPPEAIAILKNGELREIEETHDIEWVLVVGNKVYTGFPFNPNVVHFKEVYNESVREGITS